MIHSLVGKIVNLQASDVLFLVGPIILKISVPLNVMSQLEVGRDNVTLYTSLIWKDTGPQLYGFTAPEQVELFERLQTVSGIGSKLALSIMGHYDGAQISKHIHSGDAVALSRIPGIGNKTAQRMILELKDKAATWNFNQTDTRGHPHAEDALKALINLGYPPLQARRMVESASSSNPSTDLGSLITLSLQKGT